jgi:membrane protein YdbS with pleckstrin-like domain
MYEPTRNLLLRFLKVPLEPHPPLGDPASVRVFRAGRNYFRLRLFAWVFAQTLALAGIVFWAVVFIQVEDAARIQKQQRAAGPAPVVVKPPGAPGIETKPPAAAVAPADATAPKSAKVEAFKKSLEDALKAAKKRPRMTGWTWFKQFFVEVALLLPDWTFPLIWFLKIFGFAIYLIQIPITYAVRRLDYEMHWYMVTDRSLRLRTGIWQVQELTMSFANLQQVVVTQGPLQRALGLADVRVQSAGGAGTELTRQAQQNSLHSGYFHSVDNATEIRDLILERLRRFRESGLGDPDEARRAHPPAQGNAVPAPAPGAIVESELLAAAREFHDEARALRIALG